MTIRYIVFTQTEMMAESVLLHFMTRIQKKSVTKSAFELINIPCSFVAICDIII